MMIDQMLDFKILRDEGEFKILVARYRMPNGQEVSRPLLDHPKSVLVIPELTDGRFRMIRQFRAGLGRVTIEFPCGKVAVGEDLQTAARRETAEEGGCRVDGLEPIGEFAPAPGLSSEVIQFYRSPATPMPPGERPAHDEDELFEEVDITPEDLERDILADRVIDGKTVAAFFRWKTHTGLRR